MEILSCLELRQEVDLRISRQAWGASIDLEPPESLQDLAERVLIVEMPGLETEQRLIDAGHRLKIIDHHFYQLPDGTELDRRQGQASIEQVARYFSFQLNAWQQLVAWNDRGYIWELLKQRVSHEAMLDLRAKERRILHETRGDAGNWVSQDGPSGLQIYAGGGVQIDVLDRVLIPDAVRWREYAGNPEGLQAVSPTLVFLHLKNNLICAFDLYGSRKKRELLQAALPACNTSWSGGGERHGFLGGRLIQPCQLEQLIVGMTRKWEEKDV